MLVQYGGIYNFGQKMAASTRVSKMAAPTWVSKKAAFKSVSKMAAFRWVSKMAAPTWVPKMAASTSTSKMAAACCCRYWLVHVHPVENLENLLSSHPHRSLGHQLQQSREKQIRYLYAFKCMYAIYVGTVRRMYSKVF